MAGNEARIRLHTTHELALYDKRIQTVTAQHLKREIIAYK
jgi:hypothetical protein